MLSDFFQTLPLPLNQLTGSYDIKLVALSYAAAVFASYIALDITGRLRETGNTDLINLLWMIGGAIAMGAGIWSMHFIGMLSFNMPHMTMHYDLLWTILSLIVAVLISGFALFLLKTQIIHVRQLAFGGIILGIGIASMHYLGMEGMRGDMDIHYLPDIFFLSVLIAILASEAALWLAIKSNAVVARTRVRLKIISALVMGVAICGMHYTGMFAAVFTPKNSHLASAGALDPAVLSIAIAGVTFVILGIAFFASSYKEAVNHQQLEIARQLGMAEVAASVLHNVGNVLNSVNVSVNLLSEKISHSRLNELKDLEKLLKDHQHDFADFLASSGSQLPTYLMMLHECWEKEKSILLDEADLLVRHIQHIKDIVSAQQNLSKIKGIEHVVSIQEMLDEVLLMTNLTNNNEEIAIQKHYENTPPMTVDKLKLLQILVNLMSNAKDALKASTQENKCITLSLRIKNKNTMQIDVGDNGIGILPEYLKKVFVYGFTTKPSGHGYGLHASALAVKEMGGMIFVESLGLEKGTTFRVELPYKKPG